MATILKQLTVREAVGTEFTNALPAPPLAVFSATELAPLLAGTTPAPEGIRFHFEKAADNSTVGLIAVSLGVVSVDSPAGGTVAMNRELTSDTKKYLRRSHRNTTAADLTAQEYLAQFPGQASKAVSRDGISNACVFFSRNDLKTLLGRDGVVEIALFVTTIERTFVTEPQRVVETYDTLVAVGRGASGAQVGNGIRSEAPCPPHCGDDYPPE